MCSSLPSAPNYFHVLLIRPSVAGFLTEQATLHVHLGFVWSTTCSWLLELSRAYSGRAHLGRTHSSQGVRSSLPQSGRAFVCGMNSPLNHRISVWPFVLLDIYLCTRPELTLRLLLCCKSSAEVIYCCTTGDIIWYIFSVNAWIFSDWYMHTTELYAAQMCDAHL